MDKGRGGADRAAEVRGLGLWSPGGATPASDVSARDAIPVSAAPDLPATVNRPDPGTLSRKRSRLARQESRSPPSAYRIRNSAARPGGPNLSLATRTSVRWPTTSRPNLIQDRRLNSNRNVETCVSTLDMAEGRFGGSRTISWTPARRASEANRPNRSARVAAGIPAPFSGR